MAEELDSLEDLLAMIAHDLRTPLAVVQTTTAMLMNPKYQLGSEQVHEQYARIRRNVDLMSRMLGEVNDFAHLRTGQFSLDAKAVDLDEVLRNALTTLQPVANTKGVSLACEPPVTALTATVDPVRIAQAFATLLGHCIETAARGERIAVSCRAEGGSMLIEIALRDQTVAPEDLAHWFDPSCTASQPRKSATGLRLYVARGIVQAHGGDVSCTQGTGGGMAISIRLPLAG